MHIADLLHAAGVPEDVFVPVIGGGATGAALLRQPVDGVFFTGSYATGAKIAASAGKRMIKVQLELGGKDPVYVCDDVDVKAAAAAVADGAFYNTGQSCCSVERIYVHESIYDAVRRRVRRRGEGVPRSAIRWTRRRTSARSRAGRSSTCCGGRWPTRGARARRCCSAARAIKRKGNWFAPTVLADVDHSMLVMRDESFGPIIGIQAVADDDAADRPDERHRVRADGRRLHAATRRARGACCRACTPAASTGTAATA